MTQATFYNLNPDNVLQDCCDGGGMIGMASTHNKSLFIGASCCKKWLENLVVEPEKTFKHGEFAKVVAGVITKLTAAPTAADQLVLISYALDSTAVSIAAGKGQSRASVISAVDGLNIDAVIMPAGVVITDNIRALLAAKGFGTKQLYTGV
jgi:hypothetical protein